MELYRRSQFGRLLASLFIFGIFLALMITLFPDTKETPGPSILAAHGLLLIALLGFTRMTVRVTEESVEIRFLSGLLKKRVPLEQIVSIEEKLIPWYALGIKRIRKGWAWGVAPGPALDLMLANGRIVRIGTDEPGKLFQAIEDASKKTFRTPS